MLIQQPVFSTVVSSSGTDRIDFKFYDLLEQILDKQPSTSAAVVTDSIEISEDSDSELTSETSNESPPLIKIVQSLLILGSIMQFYRSVMDVHNECIVRLFFRVSTRT